MRVAKERFDLIATTTTHSTANPAAHPIASGRRLRAAIVSVAICANKAMCFMASSGVKRSAPFPLALTENLLLTLKAANSLLRAARFFCANEFHGCAITSITGFIASCLTTANELTAFNVPPRKKRLQSLPVSRCSIFPMYRHGQIWLIFFYRPYFSYGSGAESKLVVLKLIAVSSHIVLLCWLITTNY